MSAGSFRAVSLVRALIATYGQNIEIEVITTQPNRYFGYEGEVEFEESGKPLKIHRIKVPQHKSAIFDQIRSFIFFAYQALKIIKSQRYDIVFSTSSRLMTATLGAAISKWKKVPLYLDIRDIFLDTIKNVIPKVIAIFVIPVISLIEYFTIMSADHINLVSPGFGDYFRDKYPTKSFSYFMNGIDEEFLHAKSPLEKNFYSSRHLNEPLKILYAGNIGDGQGLHKIIPLLAKTLGERANIRLIGGGGRIKELQCKLNLMCVNNVVLLPPVARMNLMREYQEADILFLHLNSYDAFKKVLPSKIFEYAALGKPILAGVSGYAADFLSQEVLNSAVFIPCDVNGAIKALDRLMIKTTNRDKFIAKYSRINIMNLLVQDISNRLERE